MGQPISDHLATLATLAVLLLQGSIPSRVRMSFMRALPILSPCAESFDAMDGDSKRRHCAECDKDVHDLSAGTEEEARVLLREAAGTKICIRYGATATGTIQFRATLGVRASSHERTERMRCALAVAAVAAAAAIAGCSSVDTSAPAARPVAVPHADGGADANERIEIMMGQYVEDDTK